MYVGPRVSLQNSFKTLDKIWGELSTLFDNRHTSMKYVFSVALNVPSESENF
jgi:hypothetical protein